MTTLQSYLEQCKARVAQGDKPETIVFSLSSYMREQAKLIAVVECLREGLEQIDNEWCLHPGMPPAVENRQWCTACSEWIYPNEVNPAREALAKAEKIVGEL